MLAVPDTLAVRLLDDRRVVEAPCLLNVRRLQVETHNPILLSAQRSRPPTTFAATKGRHAAARHFPLIAMRVGSLLMRPFKPDLARLIRAPT